MNLDLDQTQPRWPMYPDGPTEMTRELRSMRLERHGEKEWVRLRLINPDDPGPLETGMFVSVEEGAELVRYIGSLLHLTATEKGTLIEPVSHGENAS